MRLCFKLFRRIEIIRINRNILWGRRNLPNFQIPDCNKYINIFLVAFHLPFYYYLETEHRETSQKCEVLGKNNLHQKRLLCRRRSP
jgi:hypothetical protein